MAYPMPQLEGVKHRFITTRGMRFHSAVAGRGSPVLLVHDWPQHWYAWRLVIPHLAERHQVIALDLRGFGWSDIAWTGFETTSLVDDVLAVLDGLELDRVAYVGHGWGGWLGFAAALRHPRRITRLCALGPLPPWIRPTPGALAALVRLRANLAVALPLLGPQLCRSSAFVKHTLRRFAADRSSLDEDVLHLYARDLHATTRARAASLLNRALLVHGLAPALAGRERSRSLATPTLVLTGERDLVRPRTIEARPMEAEDLRFETLAGAGHLLPEERPDLISERVIAFIGEPGPTAADRTPGVSSQGEPS